MFWHMDPVGHGFLRHSFTSAGGKFWRQVPLHPLNRGMLVTSRGVGEGTSLASGCKSPIKKKGEEEDGKEKKKRESLFFISTVFLVESSNINDSLLGCNM